PRRAGRRTRAAAPRGQLHDAAVRGRRAPDRAEGGRGGRGDGAGRRGRGRRGPARRGRRPRLPPAGPAASARTAPGRARAPARGARRRRLGAQAAEIEVRTQSRPLALAAYSAWSATCSASSMSSTVPGTTVCTPTLADTRTGGPCWEWQGPAEIAW